MYSNVSKHRMEVKKKDHNQGLFLIDPLIQDVTLTIKKMGV
jgi:hypothetical protein